MSSGNLFWFLIGAMSALAAAVAAYPLLRAASSPGPGRGRSLLRLAASVVAVSAVALLLYSRTGRPDLVASGAAASVAGAEAVTPPHTGVAPAATGAKVEPLEAAAARLAQRLAQGNGSDADWTLLAQSYDFMGRSADAALAREHKLPAAGANATAAAAPAFADRAAADASALQARVARDPQDGRSWLGLAEARRAERDFAAARVAFARAAALGALTADGWADYADVLASNSGGSLAGAPAEAIRRALALDAKHPKALWLEASLALEQHHYPEALATWRRLRSALPADSPDLRVVNSNIAEAEALANGKTPPPTDAGALRAAGSPAPSDSAAGSAPSAVRVTGTVQLAPRLLSKVSRGMTLFIFAKSPQSPGPPLAVMRTEVDRWPVSFALDDSMAMMPARRLSGFESVVIEARISRSGNAIAAAGDLVATSPTIHPRDRRVVALTIDHEIT